MADARRAHAQPLEIHHRGLVAELHAALFVEHQGCVRHAVQAVRQEAPQVAHAGQGAAQFADAMLERGAVAERLRARFVQHWRVLALQTAQLVVHVAQRGLPAAPAPHRIAERDAQQRRAGANHRLACDNSSSDAASTAASSARHTSRARLGESRHKARQASSAGSAENSAFNQGGGAW